MKPLNGVDIRPAVLVLVVLLLALSGTGCERERIVTITEPPAATLPLGAELDPAIVGSWLVTYGDVMPEFVVEATITAFTVDPDGLADVYLLEPLSGVRSRARAYVLDDGQAFALDFSREPAFAYYPGAKSQIYPIAVIDGDFLGLSDGTGRIAMLRRQVALPPGVVPAALPFALVAQGLPTPQYFTDIVSWSGDLCYTSDQGQLERFDPATQMLLAPLGPTNSRLLQTTQGDHFWTHCGCGGSRDLFRRDLTTVYDTMSSETEFPTTFTFRAAAHQASSDMTWVHGNAWDYNNNYIFVVDATSEPDEVIITSLFKPTLRGMAFDADDDLWAVSALATQQVVRIDPSTRQAVETFATPDLDVDWHGIVFGDDGAMYLLGEDPAAGGVIYRTLLSASVP